MHGSENIKIYLQPLGILRGCIASSAVKSGQARWLAGGALAFNMVRIIFRKYGARCREELVPISRLDHVITDLTPVQQQEISEILHRICGDRTTMIYQDATDFTWQRPLIQGIVNVTPDSFSDGGRYDTKKQAVDHARDLIAEGADIIDIGGESTRPGATRVSIEEELERVIPVIEALSDISVPLSVDTRNGDVMAAAIKAGATMINDVSALSHDSEALGHMAAEDCPVILMHAQNAPETMQHNPRYNDVVLDVYDYLEQRLSVCEGAGIRRDRLIIDPGIGFGKTVDHNIALMANLSLLHGLGVPLLLGVSRKRFIGQICKETAADGRLAGSLAFGQAGYDQGVQILRVHDVRQSRQARDCWAAVKY
ncbi:MAG: dihydropteroate synthase [Emcibacter sp.]|nr:dihydropteroate synthase [Emcibacter sp.]